MALVAAMALTSCNDSVTTDELVEIVANGKLEFVDADHIAVIAEAAGRDNITIKRERPAYVNADYRTVVYVNEAGRENCAALLY